MSATTEYGVDLLVQLGIGRQAGMAVWDTGHWDSAVWANADTSLGDWVDVTCETQTPLTLTAGASDADGVVTRWEAATCALTLLGSQWDPWAGPWAGIVGPQVALRVSWRKTGGSTWLAAFTGTVAADGWAYVPGKQPQAHVSATDATQNLAAFDPVEQSPVGLGETAAERVHRILDMATWPANLRDVTPGGVKLKSSTMAEALWTQLLAVADTDLALLWFKRDGKLAFRPEGRVGVGVDLAARLVICPPAPPVPNVGPTAAFTHTETDLTTAVNGAGSTDPDGSIVAYAWTFGDGGTATGVTASHTYAGAGTYTVRLTVTDDDGATNAVSHAVSVAPSPWPEAFSNGMPTDITHHASVAIDNAIGNPAPALHSSGAGYWWQGNTGSRWDIAGDFTYTFDIKINGPGDGARDIYHLVFWGNGPTATQNGFVFRLQSAANDGGFYTVNNGNLGLIPGYSNDVNGLVENAWYRINLSVTGTIATATVTPRLRDIIIRPEPMGWNTSVDLAPLINAAHPKSGYFGQRDGGLGSPTGDWIDNISLSKPAASRRDALLADPAEVQVVTIGGAQFTDIRNIVSVSRQAEDGANEAATVTVRDDASGARYLRRAYARTDLQHQSDTWSTTVANAILASSAWPSRAPREAELSSRLGDPDVPALLLGLEPNHTFDVEDTAGVLWREGCVGWQVTVGTKSIDGTIQLSDVGKWVGANWDTGIWDQDRWSYAVTIPGLEESDNGSSR